MIIDPLRLHLRRGTLSNLIHILLVLFWGNDAGNPIFSCIRTKSSNILAIKWAKVNVIREEKNPASMKCLESFLIQ
jgi:hypothetical protein